MRITQTVSLRLEPKSKSQTNGLRYEVMVLTRCSPLTLLLWQSRKVLQLVRTCFGELNSGREERTRVDPLVTLRDEQQGRTYFWAK